MTKKACDVLLIGALIALALAAMAFSVWAVFYSWLMLYGAVPSSATPLVGMLIITGMAVILAVGCTQGCKP